jgi:hypothetical protein
MSFDRVRESSTTTGTGALTLAGAPAGFRGFNTVYAPGGGVPVYYVVEGVTVDGLQTGQWEIGVGALAGDGTLTRGNIVASSNAGALVVFAAGTKRVFDAATVGAVDAMIAAGAGGAAAGDRAGVRADGGNDWGYPGVEWFLQGESAQALATNDMEVLPFTCHANLTLTDLMVDVTAPSVSGSGQFALYAASIVNGEFVLGARIAILGTVSTVGVGLKSLTGLSQALTRGTVYALAFAVNDTVTMRKPWYKSAFSRHRRNASNATYGIFIVKWFAAASYPPPSTGPTVTAVGVITATQGVCCSIMTKWTTP